MRLGIGHDTIEGEQECDFSTSSDDSKNVTFLVRESVNLDKILSSLQSLFLTSINLDQRSTKLSS